MKPQIAILGAGNGAHAFAGDLAMRGYPVRIYNKFENEITDLQTARGVQCEEALEGFGALELVTTDIAPVIADAEFIFVVVPAIAHAFMAEACAPHLRDDQVIILNPGRTGGALEFRNVLNRLGVKARVFIAEAQTLLYTCRISGAARVRISSVKNQVKLAAFPARDTATVLERLNPLYPQFVAAADVLETGLDNIGAMFHPTTTILSVGRIESGAPFEFYRDMTPSIARFIEVMDAERIAVAKAFGVQAQSACEWLARSYEGITGDTLYDRIQSNVAYRGIAAPRSINTRYIWEDVPTGLVPMVALAHRANVEMPACVGLVNVACALLGRDFWQEGRNAPRLGIERLSIAQVKAMVKGD
ncbi:MAG: NAD/NADP octopine/nopaline dehydrogenase family protein [Chloroflexi bacterium]|nr:NAD/NADP octopine/nopaline dehydrogenase family protein [Chloroflexota bacterium]